MCIAHTHTHTLQANKNATNMNMERSWTLFLIGRLMGRIGFVLGIISMLFVLILIFISSETNIIFYRIESL